MQGYDASSYGERIADVYDELHRSLGEGEAIIERLVELAAGGRALELGIGTGRIALPLSARGVEVHGIDASSSMVAKLRAKPGGESIPVTIGDFREVAVETGEAFSLIFVAFNTFYVLATQEAQVECFRNVAAHLAQGGVFVIEAFVPDVARFDRGQRAGASAVHADAVLLEASRHDPVNQRVDTQQVWITEGGIRLIPVCVRYAWPAELDLMARLAGLRLRERWSGWAREPFTATSGGHVSIYERGA